MVSPLSIPVFVGIDVGAVTTKVVAIHAAGKLLAFSYVRNHGRVADSLERALGEVRETLPPQIQVLGAAATGSGRASAVDLVGADVVKNEITAQALGALDVLPDVQTIIEIGGQDSKIIILREATAVDFAVNTACAAGTGSFLDHQAERLGVGVEEFGYLARKSQSPADIPGRCTVFAETDMIHLQQLGTPVEDIAAGLCNAIVRNFLTSVVRRMEIRPPVAFQGGVAGNVGVKDAFERALGMPIIVPPHHEVIGAIGAAILAREWREDSGEPSRFHGW